MSVFLRRVFAALVALFLIGAVQAVAQVPTTVTFDLNQPNTDIVRNFDSGRYEVFSSGRGDIRGDPDQVGIDTFSVITINHVPVAPGAILHDLFRVNGIPLANYLPSAAIGPTPAGGDGYNFFFDAPFTGEYHFEYIGFGTNTGANGAVNVEFRQRVGPIPPLPPSTDAPEPNALGLLFGGLLAVMLLCKFRRRGALK